MPPTPKQAHENKMEKLKKEPQSTHTESYTFDELQLDLAEYIRAQKRIDEKNKKRTYKKKRHDNFPSEISENIAKFAFYHKYGILPTWDTTVGDLQYHSQTETIQIEVKGFMSDGPSSFGPTEKWNIILFVDCKRYAEEHFTVYCIPFANDSTEWKALRLRKGSNSITYGETATKNERGNLRGSFVNIIQPQLTEDQCFIIFEGNIAELQQ